MTNIIYLISALFKFTIIVIVLFNDSSPVSHSKFATCMIALVDSLFNKTSFFNKSFYRLTYLFTFILITNTTSHYSRALSKTFTTTRSPFRLKTSE